MPTLIASTTHSITRCARTRTRTGSVGSRKTNPDSVRADTPIRSGPSHSRLSKVNGFYMVDSLPFYCRRRVSPSASASATLCCRSTNERTARASHLLRSLPPSNPRSRCSSPSPCQPRSSFRFLFLAAFRRQMTYSRTAHGEREEGKE